MTTAPVDPSQRVAARVAGVALLLGLAIVVISNFGINFRLIIPGNAVDTARNVTAHPTLIRLNVACNLLYLANLLVLLSALYVILGPVGRGLALFAASCRLVCALMWGVTALDTLGALRLLGDAVYLPAFEAAQLQALARLQLASGYDAYYVGLPFWGIASTTASVLWLRSRYVPRPLALFGVVASAWGVFCALAFTVFPRFSETVDASLFDVPLVLFEMALGLWLLIKGLASPPAPLRD